MNLSLQLRIFMISMCVEDNTVLSEFSAMNKSNMLVKKESMGSEKHISVDPFSLRESGTSQLVMYPDTTAKKGDVLSLPQLLPPSKPKFLSYSLPNSAASSPKFGSNISKNKSRHLNQAASLRVKPFYRQDSIALANLERLRHIHLQRSKSCGEGRACVPSEGLDLWLMKTNSVKHDKSHGDIEIHKAEVKVDEYKMGGETMDSSEEKVKCGALCLFLPGFGKAKPVRAMKEEPEMSHLKEPEMGHAVVSKRVSLEKFECASWRSSAIIDDNEDDKDSSNLFYDLPLEMIRCSSVRDTHSPVTAAFIFDKDRKGVLKKSSSRTTPKKSPDSSRHVRFSTSSPASYPTSPTSCVTPRLQEAREEFNAFLEAQSA